MKRVFPFKGQKRAGNALAIVGVVIGLTGGALWEVYDHTRPSVLNTVSGRVYSLSTHGHTVYLTMAEQGWLWGLLVGAVVCFITAKMLLLYAE